METIYRLSRQWFERDIEGDRKYRTATTYHASMKTVKMLMDGMLEDSGTEILKFQVTKIHVYA